MGRNAELLQLLADKQLTLGSAESITGGLFAGKMTEVPGSSAVFKGGIVAYDPAVKKAVLGVRGVTLKTKGVVSAQVAAEMARGGAKALGVDICVSCTGNAGPTAQEGEEPVGKVYLGLAYNGAVWTIPLSLAGSREEIRKATIEAMIAFVQSLFVGKEN